MLATVAAAAAAVAAAAAAAALLLSLLFVLESYDCCGRCSTVMCNRLGVYDVVC